MSIFEKASRLRLRFETCRGLVMVEDLWDMPLIESKTNFSLDALAKQISRELKLMEEESFVKPHSTANTTQALALDIVKRVIEVKLKNIETQEKRAATKARKDKILEILASKEDDSLREKSAEELKKMLEDD